MLRLLPRRLSASLCLSQGPTVARPARCVLVQTKRWLSDNDNLRGKDAATDPVSWVKGDSGSDNLERVGKGGKKQKREAYQPSGLVWWSDLDEKVLEKELSKEEYERMLKDKELDAYIDEVISKTQRSDVEVAQMSLPTTPLGRLQHDTKHRANPSRAFFPKTTYEPADLNPFPEVEEQEPIGRRPKIYKKPHKHLRSSGRNCPIKAMGITEIDYKNIRLLARFLSSNGQILPRRITGVQMKNQRKLARAIKRARVAGLIPYTSKPEFPPQYTARQREAYLAEVQRRVEEKATNKSKTEAYARNSKQGFNRPGSYRPEAQT